MKKVINEKRTKEQGKTQTTAQKLVMGVHLGNSFTTIYFKDKYYKLHSQLTINLTKKQITFGRQPTSLEQKLQAKYNSLKQSVLEQDISQKQYQPDKQRHMIDFIDLYIKGFTQRNISLQQRQKDIFQSNLPKCFNYYGHQFGEQSSEGVSVVLEKGNKIDQKDILIWRKDRNVKQFGYGQKDHKQIVEKIEQQTIRLDQCVNLFVSKVLQEVIALEFSGVNSHPNMLKGAKNSLKDVNNNRLKDNKSEQSHLTQQIQLIINYHGFEGNPYICSLSNIKSLSLTQNPRNISPIASPLKCTTNLIYTCTSQAIYFYTQHLQQINQLITKSTIIATLDFGSRGFCFSVFKLYPTNQNVIQTLQHFSLQFGGVDVTRVLVDIIIDHVKLHKGVNIGSTPQMTKELYKLAEETKLALSEAQEVYVRIQGYPLQQPYGFYLKRFNLQRLIQAKLLYIVNETNRLCNKYPNKIKYLIASGQSLNIPLFKQLLNDKLLNHLNAQIIDADPTWIAKGNYLWRQSGVIILQKSQSSIVIKGDQQYNECLLQKGREMPVRLVKEIPFPRGQLAYNMRFYENQRQIGRYVIESKHLEWDLGINFVAEKEENKPLFVYSTKYLGDIQLKGSNLCKQVQLNEQFRFDVNFAN